MSDPSIGAGGLRVLMAHNAYQQRGGEDAVVEAELGLLRMRGHAVTLYRRHNDEIAQMGRLALMADTLWSRRTLRDAQALIEAERPDVLHVHNTFPLISPTIMHAAWRAGVPVVQTLHNFRLLCPQAMLLREGRVCEDCVGHLPWRGIIHACYRESRVQTGVLTGMTALHRALGSWREKVTRFIALSEFGRAKFIEGGLPAERLKVKPNFVDCAPPVDGAREDFLFVGRLSPEKGIAVMGEALRSTGEALRLRVAGDGPLKTQLDGMPGVQTLGALGTDAVRAQMMAARALLLPSICYEGFPRTLVEAYAAGLPVIASRLGALAELVEDGVTGLLVPPADGHALAEAMCWAQANPARMAEMGRAARARYERLYSAEVNYGILMQIYAEAIEARRAEATS